MGSIIFIFNDLKFIFEKQNKNKKKHFELEFVVLKLSLYEQVCLPNWRF